MPESRRPAVWLYSRRGLLFLVDDFRVDDRAFVFTAFRWPSVTGISSARSCLRPGAFAGFCFFASGFVELGRDALPGFVQFFAAGRKGGGVVAFECFLHFVDRALNFAL